MESSHHIILVGEWGGGSLEVGAEFLGQVRQGCPESLLIYVAPEVGVIGSDDLLIFFQYEGPDNRGCLFVKLPSVLEKLSHLEESLLVLGLGVFSF